MKKLFLITLCLAILAACSFNTVHRGYIFPEDIESVVGRAKTGAALEKELGSPMTKTIHGDTVWIYYGADENSHGPFPHSYDNKTALLVWVNKSDRITKTKILRDDELPDIKLADGETKIPAAIELNVFQELVNNVGRFTPAGLGQ